MLREEQYAFSEDAEEAFKEYLERRMEQPRFANGRSVRNAIERARPRHASRVVNEMDEVGKDDLIGIEAEDILKSRVFADQDEGMYGQSGNGSDRKKSDEDGKSEAKSDDGKGDSKSDDGDSGSESEEKEEVKA